MSVELLVALGRVCERLLIVGLAGFSLWMGWRLFYARLSLADQTAEFTIKDIVIKLQKVAPGVMFAFFGAAILGIALWQNLKVTDPATNRQVAYLGGNTAETRRLTQALNLAVSLASLPANTPISPPDRARLSARAEDLTLLRNELVRSIGPENFAIWSKYAGAYQRNKDDVPKEYRGIVEEVFRLMQDTGG
jgi:hypothetical protein